jgi:dTDP-glucose 4,6-dehydratase
MKNILISGSAGFIGSNFVRYMLSTHPDINIVSLDYLSYAGSLLNLKDLPDESRHTFIRGNTCDRQLVKGILKDYNIDTIVNFAAESHVDRSIINPEKFVQMNINCTFNLLETAREVWKDLSGKRFHQISTDEVYGSLTPEDFLSTELTPCHPTSPYAAAKAAADYLCNCYFLTYSLPVTISRCSNNYGAYQLPEKLIPRMILLAMTGEDLTIHGDGQQIRDWIYVIDHCNAIDLILHKGRLGEIYNVGGHNQTSNLEIIERVIDYVMSYLSDNAGLFPLPRTDEYGLSFSIRKHEVIDRLGNDRRYGLNTNKIYDELGWMPMTDLDTGLRATVQWYLEHWDWMLAMKKQLEEAE